MTSAPQGYHDLPELPPTSWAVLGMLAFGEEISGYDIKKWADWSIRHYYWSPSFSQVYSELKRLEKYGFASSRMVAGDRGRPRRMYLITESGRRAVAVWETDAPVEPPILKHGVLLRVGFGHLSSPDRLKRMLLEHARRMGELQHRVTVDAAAAEAEPAWAYSRLAMRWAERYYASERELAYSLIDDIDETEQTLAAARRDPDAFPRPEPGQWREVEKQVRRIDTEERARPD